MPGCCPSFPSPTARPCSCTRRSSHGIRRGLTAGAHAGILVHEQDGPDKDPLQIERLMFDCTVQPFERKSAEWEAGRELYLARFPDSRVTFGLGDFTLYRLQFVAGTYVAGFGRAMDIEPQDIRRLAEPA